MTMHDPRDISETTLEVAGIYQLLNQFGRTCAHDMAAQNLPVLSLADKLYQSTAVAIDRCRSDCAERHSGDRDVNSLSSRR
jgi:hypothetical protein